MTAKAKDPVQVQPDPNTSLWDALGKTDPNHTKGFKRSGGFSGTALKPMWVWQRLTEKFGPMGTGWGCDKPEFQTMPGAGQEMLVYCTVAGWYIHNNERAVVFGVGGDKVIAAYSKGPSSDDEAFKKAYTDALMNAFKFIGVGADVHMGRFDDNKYVQQLQEEFTPAITQEEASEIEGKILDTGTDKDKFLSWAGVSEITAIPATLYDEAIKLLDKKRKPNPNPQASEELGDEIPY